MSIEELFQSMMVQFGPELRRGGDNSIILGVLGFLVSNDHVRTLQSLNPGDQIGAQIDERISEHVHAGRFTSTLADLEEDRRVGRFVRHRFVLEHLLPLVVEMLEEEVRDHV